MHHSGERVLRDESGLNTFARATCLPIAGVTAFLRSCKGEPDTVPLWWAWRMLRRAWIAFWPSRVDATADDSRGRLLAYLRSFGIRNDADYRRFERAASALQFGPLATLIRCIAVTRLIEGGPALAPGRDLSWREILTNSAARPSA